VLGLIDDPITKDLQESQSKLIGARWIGLAASEDESGFCVFRGALINVNHLKWQQVTKVVTGGDQVMN